MSTPRWLVAVAVVGIAALAAASFLFGRLSVGPTPAAPTAVDVGFSRDMAVHHQQAVLMSQLVRDRATDEELRAIALDMVLTQTNQTGHLQGWLRLWGEPLAVEGPPMTWMAGHEGHGADEPMAGLASQADLNALEASAGVEAERRYLTLMIPHHAGGVEMAQYAVEHASVPAVRDLAGSMVSAQTTEMETLRKLLEVRGGPLR
ncbi:MAG: DUF305 domain-containing protein [Actinomycetes bacterium]